MGADVRVHQLKNGLTLIGDVRPWVSSGAFSILVPLGASTDPIGQFGAASILTEMFNKGAGEFDSRQLSAEFEDLGVQRGQSAGLEVSVFSGACLGRNLPRVLELYATMLRKPRFPESELENVRQLAIQDLRSLEDEPASKVLVELTKDFYPDPFGRDTRGTLDGVQAVTLDSLKNYYDSDFVADRAIIGVAGNIDWDEIKETVEQQFGDWGGSTKELDQPEVPTECKVRHIERDSAQEQIALAFPSVPITHDQYYTARVAVNVLSGGMASRLFIEVREKRGLVYSVRASYNAARNRAAVFGYAGTTPQNAEETLAVMMTEFRKLKDGVSEEELSRAKADIKSRLVISSEASSARAGQLVNDWWSIGRVRDIEEIKSNIDAVSDAAIRQHLADNPVSAITLLTLGPKELELPA